AGLYIFNTVFAATGLTIGINIASASIVGVLGLPGLLLMIILKFIYK
ncbi:MAG: pro-sigmaK processing inhibitor BofA family protein, partial [Clostridia bacterium]|nr:pro-sigmaK processing inhibitor BofA family protein [Clostridia bacterium]